MKIVFMGTPDFAVATLEALATKYEVVLVISQPNRAKKKGVFIPTPVASKALELGLNLIQPENISDEYEYIKNMNADIMVTAAYGQYVPTKILKLFKHSLNVHGSLLPKHRGGAPIQRCLINGDSKTGVTIMEMVKKLDGGRMYAQEVYNILPTDNSTILFEKLSIIGKDLLMNNIEQIVSGEIGGEEQDEALATYSANIAKEEEKIDITKTSREIVNLIRGLSNEPGAYLEVNGIKLKVLEALEVATDEVASPGVVLDIKKQIIIKTGDTAISLLRVIMPGKNATTGKEFANGQRLFAVGESII